MENFIYWIVGFYNVVTVGKCQCSKHWPTKYQGDQAIGNFKKASAWKHFPAILIFWFAKKKSCCISTLVHLEWINWIILLNSTNLRPEMLLTKILTKIKIAFIKIEQIFEWVFGNICECKAQPPCIHFLVCYTGSYVHSSFFIPINNSFFTTVEIHFQSLYKNCWTDTMRQ